MKAHINITIDETLVEQLRAKAALDNRSLSNVIETIVREWLK